MPKKLTETRNSASPLGSPADGFLSKDDESPRDELDDDGEYGGEEAENDGQQIISSPNHRRRHYRMVCFVFVFSTLYDVLKLFDSRHV